MSEFKWSMRFDFEEHPDGGGELVFRVKTSKTGGEWREGRRAVVPEGVDIKMYMALGEMADYATGNDEEMFWVDLFRREVPGLYEDHKAKPRLNEEPGSAGKVNQDLKVPPPDTG